MSESTTPANCHGSARCASPLYWELKPYGRNRDPVHSCRQHFGMVADALIAQYRIAIMVRRINNADR